MMDYRLNLENMALVESLLSGENDRFIDINEAEIC